MTNDAKEVKISFRQKSPTVCPLCHTEFYREELFSGGGRLIAGDLNDELRREYQKSKKFGIINPLIYSITVCPGCYYSTLPEDFSAPIKDTKQRLHNDSQERKYRIQQVFQGINFNNDRTLELGVASYILAVSCYSFFEKKYAPSLKRAITAIRAAWLLEDLFNKSNDEKYHYIKNLFYNKAAFFYHRSVENAQTGREIIDGVKHYGPDADKNFGYDGMLYMASLLNYKIADQEKDIEKQAESYLTSKRIVGKLFGMGKASKDKPTAILDLARDVYTLINTRLKELEEQLGRKLD